MKLKQLIWAPLLALAQATGAPALEPIKPLKIPVGSTEAWIFFLTEEQVDKDCLSKRLKEVYDLYRERKLDQIRTLLFLDHPVVTAFRKNPYAVIPLEGTQEKLAVSILDNGHVVFSFREWDPTEEYAWYSTESSKLPLSECVKR